MLRLKGESDGGTVSFSCNFKSVYQPNKFLYGMRNGDIVMLALCTLLVEIGLKSRIPVADESGCIEC